MSALSAQGFALSTHFIRAQCGNADSGLRAADSASFLFFG